MTLPASGLFAPSMACTNPRNGGDGLSGLDLNSGWNCVAKKNRCEGSSKISIRLSFLAEYTRPWLSSSSMRSGFTS